MNIEIDLEAITIDLNTLSMNMVLRYKINDLMDHVIVLSMFLMYVVFLSGVESVHVFDTSMWSF